MRETTCAPSEKTKQEKNLKVKSTVLSCLSFSNWVESTNQSWRYQNVWWIYYFFLTVLSTIRLPIWRNEYRVDERSLSLETGNKFYTSLITTGLTVIIYFFIFYVFNFWTRFKFNCIWVILRKMEYFDKWTGEMQNNAGHIFTFLRETKNMCHPLLLR